MIHWFCINWFDHLKDKVTDAMSESVPAGPGDETKKPEVHMTFPSAGGESCIYGPPYCNF